MSVYTARHNLILGFHGCDRTIRDAVIGGQEVLKPSTNAYDWLGHGIYFWENSYDRALDFATEHAERKTSSTAIRDPSVLGAVINLGLCLDLMDAESLSLLHSAYEYLRTSLEKLGKPLPEIKGGPDRLFRNLDCAVLLTVHALREREGLQPFDSIRSAYLEGNPIYPNAGFYEKNHIQICIRNADCIKGLFLPRRAGIEPLAHYGALDTIGNGG